MPRLQRKGFSTATDVRRLGRGQMDVVDLDETAVGRIRMEPGWRWSTDVAPKMGTTSCRCGTWAPRWAGALHVMTDDGIEMQIRTGDAYEIPPRHDAWVVGDSPYEAIEFASARVFGELKGLSGARPVFALVR